MLPDAEYLPRTTVAERVARGTAFREQHPPERVAAWRRPVGRRDPVDVLRRQAETRITELVPLRHTRMLESPFAFFRGGAGIMAADVSAAESPGLRAQLCGDAHLMNFGLFATPERTLVFGINDFDETLPGPIEWDVKRLAASIEIAGRDLGFSAAEREVATVATVASYRKSMLEFAEMRNIDVWYARLPGHALEERLEQLSDKVSTKEVRKRVRRALERDHLKAFDRLIADDGGVPRFVADPPVLIPAGDLLDGEQRERYVEVVQEFLTQYRSGLAPDRRVLLESYHFVDMARKVVGVGSVGTRAWVVLFMGRDAGDPLLLQLKEAQASVLAPYAGATVHETEGQRVVAGQRLIQAASDHMLGHYRIRAFDGQMHDYYVRQLWDGKASIDLARLTAKGLTAYGDSCGWTLARAHARSGDRIAMAAWLGQDEAFEQALADFAVAYADVNEADHARLREAADAGEVPVAE